MKTVLIAQARMNSTRLPGKVLKAVLDKPLLTYFVERLRQASQIQQIIIATTINTADEPIVALCRKLSVPFMRGAEADVLSRYYDAAVLAEADIIVRVTADCPLVDPALIDETVSYFKENIHRFDYVSNSLTATYPRGMDVEVCAFAALREAFLEATEAVDREHVTPFLYTQPTRYRIGEIHAPVNLSQHRWTVDTAEDFDLIRRLIETLYPLKPEFNLADILDTLSKHPDWPLINAHITQKSLGE
jgi:spore coat polysaccharide biosynthesis protein SpsF